MKTLAIVDKSAQEDFKSYLVSTLNLLDINCCFYNLDEVDGDKCFDFVVVNSPVNRSLRLSASYCLINMDNEYDKSMNLYGRIITYGFGNKNTITISSIGDDKQGFVYCLQRYLKLNSSFTLGPQEIPIHMQLDNEIELYAFMAAITIGLIQGIDSALAQEKLNKKILTLT